MNKRFLPLLGFLAIAIGLYLAFRNATDREIEIVSVRTTAAGMMLDVRYRVADGKAAKAFFPKKSKPLLISEKSGATLTVPVPPKVGPLKQIPDEFKPDKTYFMFFANPGRHVKAGDLVTLVSENRKVEHLRVQ